MHNILKKTLIAVSVTGLISSILILSVLWAFSSNLPDYKFLKSYKPPVSSKVYSGTGQLVNDFSTEKRIFVPYKSIPTKVINAFLSAEDKNFFSHPGVDAKGVLRATINNISNIINSKRFCNTRFLLNFANLISLYGLYLLGAFGRAANKAASL